MKQQTHPMRRMRGFTLVELMIVVAIVAILATVAYPSYQSYVLKTKRTDGKIGLMELSTTLERFYTENNTYAGTTAAGVYSDESPEKYYALSITAQSATAFTIKAVPIAPHTDTGCGEFELESTGERKLAGTHSHTVEQCW